MARGVEADRLDAVRGNRSEDVKEFYFHLRLGAHRMLEQP